MDITSPFVVVPVIVLVFAASILFSTSSKEDGHHSSHSSTSLKTHEHNGLARQRQVELGFP